MLTSPALASGSMTARCGAVLRQVNLKKVIGSKNDCVQLAYPIKGMVFIIIVLYNWLNVFRENVIDFVEIKLN